jgi:LmbE family N-acetylglucosaminyl deacetylase
MPLGYTDSELEEIRRIIGDIRIRTLDDYDDALEFYHKNSKKRSIKELLGKTKPSGLVKFCKENYSVIN